jgi:hypothetical protein
MSDVIKIYMPLLDEGVEVWRPVDAERIEVNAFRILGPQPDHEKWAFPPGAVVSVLPKPFSSGEEAIGVANRLS